MSNPYIVDSAAPGAEERIEMDWNDGTVTRRVWVSVKSQLSAGEQRRLMKSVTTVSQSILRTKGGDAPAGPEAKFEWYDYSFARMVAYIVDWSLAHEAEREHRLPPTRQSYEALREDLFEMIDNALDEHEKKIQERKNAQSGKPKPEASLV